MRQLFIGFLCVLALSVQAQPLEYAKQFTINSAAFDQERTIRLSLPASYDSNSESRYPVIYVVRGQFDLLATVASLDLLDAEAPEFIVVGVDGVGVEFFPSKDKSATQYSRLLHDEVVPYIEQNYRTAPYSVIVGHSMAAIFTVTGWLDRGTLFSKYIVISPPLGGGQIIADVESRDNSKLESNSPLLVTIANEGDVMESKFEDLRNLLANHKKASFKTFPEQSHMSTRANSIMFGLREVFPDWKPSEEITKGSLDLLKQHYAMLSKRYGYQIEIPIDMLTSMGAHDSWNEDNNKNKNAVAVVKYTLARNAKNADNLFDVANQMIGFGAPNGSKRLISYICAEIPQDTRCNQAQTGDE